MSDPSRLLRPFDDGDLSVPDGPVLWLRAEAGEALSLFAPGQLSAVQGFKPYHARLEARGVTLSDQPGNGYEMAIVSASKNRAETRGLIAAAWQATAPGGWVVINGDKTEGIDALIKDVKAQVPVAGRVAKSHGKVAWLERGADTPAAFAAWQDAAAATKNAAGYWTRPGIFSPDKPDQGSMRLVAHFGPKIKGRVADFGAGWGWLSAQLLDKAEGIAALDLYEADRAALDLAERNITDPRAGFIWADIPQTPCTEPYDMIIMNPPFHEGRKAEPSIGAAFIGAAKRFLKPNGQLLMVANRHLPYESALAESFRRVEKREEDPQFKIYLAAKPKR